VQASGNGSAAPPPFRPAPYAIVLCEIV